MSHDLSNPDAAPAFRPRQADIARRAGLSVSTVSRVLAGEPGISAATRETVAKAAADLGYPLRVQPSRDGTRSSLAGRRFAILLPAERATGDLGPFYGDILDALRAAAAAEGFALDTRLLARDRADAADLGRSEATDGVFVVGLDVEGPAADGRPVVLVNGTDPAMRFDGVSPANFHGGRLGSRTLLELGHRRIAYVAGQHRATTRERARGFRAGIAETPGAAGFEGVLTFSGRTFEEAGAAVRALFAAEPGLTAVFCMNDAIALGVLSALEGLRLRVPEDVSVLGFDDLPCASLMTPRLATLRVDRKALALEAVELMRRRFAEPDAPPRQVEHAVRLVGGGTLGPVKGDAA